MNTGGDILKDLNPEQKKAVTHQSGPLLIVAGAGTGKTTVITRRLGWLIMEQGLRSDEILALTFTNKAADEMIERVDKLLPYGYVDLWVSTFHTFCQRILDSHALDIGLPGDVGLLDDTGQWLLVREHLAKFDLDYYQPTNNPTKFIRSMLSHFSRLKDEEITPEAYLAYAEGLKASSDDMEASGGKSKRAPTPPNPPSGRGGNIVEMANAYHTYQQLLLDNNKMDFGDLINYTLKLFRERPNVLKKYQTQFKHVLVDEFQDTNWAQYELVKILAKPQDNLTVVADDDQSIYRFRGASMSNVIQFSKDYRDVATVSLVKNYRSGQEILDAAYDFIQLNNPNRLEAAKQFDLNKKLVAQTKETANVEHLHAKTAHDEARMVAETIAELKKRDRDATWNDFAVLVRANSQAAIFEDALASTNIPHQNYAASGLYKTTIVANILAFFDVLDDYHESRAIFRLLNLPFLSIPIEDIVKLNHYAAKKSITLYEILLKPQAAGVSNEDSVLEMGRLRSWIEKYGDSAKREKPTSVLFDWMKDEGYFDYLNGMPDADSVRKYRYLRHFWEHLKEIEAALADARVKDIVNIIKQERESGDSGSLPPDAEAGPEMVRDMTVHSAKGLEFEYVFVTNLVDRRFPTIERKEAIEIPDALVKEVIPEGDHHLEEERRLLYVAMTRAKAGLFFTSAENYGGVQKKKLSRFLVELAEAHPSFTPSTAALAGDHASFFPKVRRAPKQDFKLPIPKRFSFTQLKIFDADPFEYKLQFIYKVPMKGKYVFSYGSTMHATLQQFFQLFSQKHRGGQTNLFSQPDPSATPSLRSGSVQDDMGVTLEELLDMYEKSWIDDWYEDAEQKEKYHKQGRSRLKDFYEHLSQSGEVPKVKALERGFSIRIGEYTIVGRMDRVDALADGPVRIVDYKTGAPKTKLSKEDKYQLLIYQIAAEEVFGEKVRELVYHYVDAENIKHGENQVSFIGNDADKQEVKDWVLAVIKRIHESDFAPAQDRFYPSEDVEYVRDLGEQGVI
ncbi:MAG: UvrD-helicase domain-containing protein [Parcubacteria group bacterium]|nr:UvrD-helicase domain-containing protein [Parcubacteria group bacterium]